eukprot:CAMPEP_0196994500 /NCGR_PEP_ID=MMETSP1380-20130617/790_1 /TAXON_ID=5936 /ORGANISM="Euplotes crassus, Strain CT5" /LENGTH=77 /DNA_ID=CAMNT_0042409897 /DNA_START=632 /DNA_END=865 /DNA_ORIENTATION=+
MQIELETQIMQAKIASNININKAEAKGQSFYKIQYQQAESLKTIKDALGLSNPDLLEYLRAKILREYPEDKMIIGMA